MKAKTIEYIYNLLIEEQQLLKDAYDASNQEKSDARVRGLDLSDLQEDRDEYAAICQKVADSGMAYSGICSAFGDFEDERNNMRASSVITIRKLLEEKRRLCVRKTDDVANTLTLKERELRDAGKEVGSNAEYQALRDVEISSRDVEIRVSDCLKEFEEEDW